MSAGPKVSPVSLRMRHRRWSASGRGAGLFAAGVFLLVILARGWTGHAATSNAPYHTPTQEGDATVAREKKADTLSFGFVCRREVIGGPGSRCWRRAMPASPGAERPGLEFGLWLVLVQGHFF